MYRLNRNAFAVQSFETAARQRDYWLAKSPAERLSAAWYLTCCAWNIDITAPPPLDRTKFSIRQHNERNESIPV